MTPKIKWTTSDGDDAVDFPSVVNRAAVERWIVDVAADLGYKVGRVCYEFCNDAKILDINRRFINHDYYTDIITFDYTHGDTVNGDIIISLDTVASNAEALGQSFDRELHRVIIHGILHLCGIDDKGPGERAVMESHEDRALTMLDAMRDTMRSAQ